MKPEESEAWASAFIAFQDDPDRMKDDHPLFWAAEQFMLPSASDPVRAEDCWAAILAVLSHKPTDVVVGMLASGPLEDLLEAAGPQLIDRMELQSRRDPAFRHLLGGVWESSTPDIWARVEAARGETW